MLKRVIFALSTLWLIGFSYWFYLVLNDDPRVETNCQETPGLFLCDTKQREFVKTLIFDSIKWMCGESVL